MGPSPHGSEVKFYSISWKLSLLSGLLTIMCKPGPLNHAAIYVLEKAIKQEGQFYISF